MTSFSLTRLAGAAAGRGAAIVALAALVAACAPGEQAPAEARVPYVRVAQPEPVLGAALGVSGTVRARVEAPLAFEVGGRVVARLADAGQSVRAGQPLMNLDPRDLDQAVQAALAEQAAAATTLATAEVDLKRARQLAAEGFVSPQATDRAELQRREALSRLDAATARLAQARHARDYAELKAPAEGVLIDVTGQPGQVVAPGQTVATLARGAREIEVFLPDGVAAPARGTALGPDGQALPLALREVAGAVDALGRTRRARYTVAAGGERLVLGSVVATRFDIGPAPAGVEAAAVFTLPVGALDERGQQAQVWRVREGRTQAVPVQVIGLDDRTVRVAGALQTDDRVVALGTHLLREGMAVRERAAP
ncbi:MAG TPA: efflux RND transporter periplasmic adaptor subunit [Ottowia sp.]|uniref:efflux RND transporter periplasmic adaptor subunit n=1 Tax=Ottowia sp. TaxID=1898956 RepID=UPI002CD80BC5|nr:efflux RND transporter periplasmic adaptor subunit [Ottowia sp.]HMN21731.1 efflux RND transporter periplasmic adaptor subunit [Ottowia sp.]